MIFQIVTAPSELPLTLDQVKAHLGISEDETADHALLFDYIRSATAFVENATRRRLMAQTADLYFDGWPRGREIEIPPPLVPVTAIAGVFYTPEGAAETEFLSTNYTLDTISDYGKIRLKSSASWPSDVLEVLNGVRVNVTVGAADRALVPDPLRVALLQIVAHQYMAREPVVIGAAANAVPFTTDALLAQYYVA